MKPTRKAVVQCFRCTRVLPDGKIGCVFCGAVNFGTKRAEEGKDPTRPDDGIQRLTEIQALSIQRIRTGFVDRNFGSEKEPGYALSSVTLLGGAPGAGKSTLCSQILSKISAATDGNVLYVGSEENAEQVKARAVRLGLPNIDRFLILSLENQMAGYKFTPEVIRYWKPRAIVLDSVQKYAPTPQAQVELCESVKEVSVEYKLVSLVISQVNKEEEFSGLQGMMHAVDSLVTFTLADELVDARGNVVTPPVNKKNPQKVEPFRILKTGKNRFGESYETYFTMDEDGLHEFDLDAAIKRLRREARGA